MLRELGIRNTSNKFLFLIILLVSLTFSCKSLQTDRKLIKTELYFGLSNLNGIKISSKEWDDFKVNTLDKNLSGYTELDSKGFWTNHENESISQNSKLIIYLYKGTEKDILTIEKIITTYKTKFKQESVLKINHKVKAIF